MMKIVITPAKRMKNDIDYLDIIDWPIYIKETEKLLAIIKTLDIEQIKKMLGCNDKIAKEAYKNYQTMNLKENAVPALLAYEGIQYANMAAHIFSDEDYEYTKEHLRILSGFYGVLKPFDGVVPYRLELNNHVPTPKFKNLYEFWKDKIYQGLLIDDDKQILDLGAKQYTRVIKKYLTSDIHYVKCSFKEEVDGKYKEIGVYVKMARGQMVRYLIENQVTDFNEVKQFSGLGYHYNQDLSSQQLYVFTRKK